MRKNSLVSSSILGVKAVLEFKRVNFVLGHSLFRRFRKNKEWPIRKFALLNSKISNTRKRNQKSYLTSKFQWLDIKSCLFKIR